MKSKINSIFYIFLLIISFLKISCNEKNKVNNVKNNYTIHKNYTSYFINSTIKTLNDKNFDTTIKHNNSINYLILFTFKRCPICNKIIKITENVEKYYTSKNNIPIAFAKVDCYLSGWTALRFDIFKIPIFIYIKNGEEYSYFMPNNDTTEEVLINYIESTDKEYKIYPEKIGYFGVFTKFLHLISENIKKKIPFWNESFTWIILFVIFIYFLYFEYSLYKSCCDSHKRNNEIKKKFNKENSKKNIKKD